MAVDAAIKLQYINIVSWFIRQFYKLISLPDTEIIKTAIKTIK